MLEEEFGRNYHHTLSRATNERNEGVVQICDLFNSNVVNAEEVPLISIGGGSHQDVSFTDLIGPRL